MERRGREKGGGWKGEEGEGRKKGREEDLFQLRGGGRGMLSAVIISLKSVIMGHSPEGS